MKLEEAIEIHETERQGIFLVPEKKLKAAHQLGIEALEFLSQWERDHNGEKLVILPSETEE